MNSRRTARVVVLFLAVLVALVAGGVLLARWALAPDTLRAVAETRLSAALGQRVTIGVMRVSLFPTVGVEGREIRVGDGGANTGAPSVALSTLRIIPRLSSIFSRPMVIDRVEVRGLTVRALRDKAGRWQLPLPSIASGGTNTGTSSVSVDVGRIELEDASLLVVDEGKPPGPGGPAGIRQIDATMEVKGGAARLERLKAKVGRSTITGSGTASAEGVRLAMDWQSLAPGDVREVFGLVGVEAPSGLSVAGERPLSLELAVDRRGAMTATGRMAASKVALGTLALTSLASPVRVAANRLTLEPIVFDLYGGKQRGAVNVDLAGAPVSWGLRSAIQGVDVNQLLSANTTAKNRLTGVGRLQADLKGTTATQMDRAIGGRISLEVSNGAVEDFPLLVSLNSALRLGTSAADRDLRFERLSATLDVARATMATSDLRAESGDLTVMAAGTLGFDQALKLTGVARFTREKSDDLVRRAKDLGGLRNPQGEIEVPFSATGTLSAPVFGLDVQKMLGRAVEKELKRQVGKGLKKLLKIR